MSRAPSFRYASPLPWIVGERDGDLIPLRTAHEPIEDVCFVAVNGNLARAEDDAAMIAWWSSRAARATA